MDGIDFLPVAIGLFGIGEVLAGAEAGRRRRARQGALRPARRHADARTTGRAAAGRSRAARCSASWSASCRAPGPTVATFLSYARREEGLEAPRGVRQAARSKASPARSRRTTPPRPAAMVPMLTLGIPGSATTAIMLGGADDVGPAARAAAVREEPAVRLGPDRLAVHRQRDAAHPQHRRSSRSSCARCACPTAS